jgi:hypothetical protein
MQKKRWADLSAAQKIGIVIGATIQFSLLVGGLWDLWRQKPEDVRGDRRFWTGFMFVNWIGPIAYFTVGRKKPVCDWRSCCRGEEPTAVGEQAPVKVPAPIEETLGLDSV